MDATIQFQQTLPFALLSISPSLAALHRSRTRRLLFDSSGQNTTHCSKCGSFLYNGDGEIRVIGRNKNCPHKDKESSRVSRRTCRTCDCIDDLTLHRGNAALFPRQSKSVIANVNVKDRDYLLPSQALRTAVSKNPGLVPFKTRPKKKSDLDSMLSRNRQIEEKERLRKLEGQSFGGLAEFLSGL